MSEMAVLDFTGDTRIQWDPTNPVEVASAKARFAELKAKKQQLEKDNSFDLDVGNRLYRIRTGLRVERLNRDTKKIESYYYIHPELSHNLPAEDVAVSQKLLLEADEQTFLKIANETKAA